MFHNHMNFRIIYISQHIFSISEHIMYIFIKQRGQKANHRDNFDRANIQLKLTIQITQNSLWKRTVYESTELGEWCHLRSHLLRANVIFYRSHKNGQPQKVKTVMLRHIRVINFPPGPCLPCEILKFQGTHRNCCVILQTAHSILIL